jgi:membrane associated rhomboid family serine protease
MPPIRRTGSSQGITLSFPPFTRVVVWIIGICASVYFFCAVMFLSPATAPLAQNFELGAALIPRAVLHGYVWQIVTYSFLHGNFLHLFMNMLMLWMFGAQVEQTWGWRRFAKFYFACVVGAALLTIAISYGRVLNLSPTSLTLGASGGVLGVLLAFGMLFPEAEIFMFPLPVLIKAKYLIAVIIVVNLAGAMSESAGVAYVAHLGGLFTGYVYFKLMNRRPRRNRTAVYIGRGLSDRAFEEPSPMDEPGPVKPPAFLARWRDSYYRWRRRRAARKFEVYMRKHDRQVYFDEQGNYIDPESAEGQRREEDEGKKPWIN